MNKNCIPSPEKAISDALITGLGLSEYQKIMDAVKAKEFSAEPKFRKLFNGYYRIRQRSTEWYDVYYGILETQLKNTDAYSFTDILNVLHKTGNKIEPSFTSKLLATADPSLPVWDTFVLRNLGLEKEWNQNKKLPPDERIKAAAQLYQELCDTYQEILSSPQGKACIEKFGKAIGREYSEKLTDEKKLDLILWSKR